MTDTGNGLDWLLNNLLRKVPGAERVVAVAQDGIVRGHAGQPRPSAACMSEPDADRAAKLRQEDDERLGALCASLRGLALVAAREYLGSSTSRMSFLEADDGILYVRVGDNGAVLGVVASPQADARLLYAEMNLLIAQVGEHLTAPPRAEGGAQT
jgi:predicted regulator of Ras-like GTPase activity (Roadblock/LC7/MglB family)